VSVATLLKLPAPGACAHSSTLSTPEPASAAAYATAIVVELLNAGELADEVGAAVSSRVVVSAPAAATSRLPALSTATV